VALDTGDKFPELRLESREGEVNLADRYRGTPLVVAFMRHFG
jgi:peroxiredoxin